MLLNFDRQTVRALGAGLLFLSMVTAPLAGCTKTEQNSNLTVFHGTLGDDAKSMDPANAYDSVSLDVVPNIYEALYQYAYLSEEYKIVPLLAADMPKYSPDRLTLTIPIKRGVKFHDDDAFKETKGKGRELKAQDFVYALKRLALPSLQSNGWWVLDGKIAGINAFHDKLLKADKAQIATIFEESVEGVQAVDDYTLRLKLVKPYPQLLYVLTMSFTAPVAREVVAAYADEKGNLTERAVGTGPYILKKWDRGQKIVLERNPNYHPEFYPTEASETFRKRGLLTDAGKPLPFIDRIEFQVIKEDQPAWLSFLKGEKDVAGIPKDNFATAVVNQKELSPELNAKGVRLTIEPAVVFYYISFNMKDKLIGSNKLLRQAISSAIDRDKWITIFTNGRGQKMLSALPPGIQDRPAKPELKYDYNVERAKDLLKKAGYPDGKGLPVIRFDMRSADSTARQMGDFFQQQLGAIGVKINVIYNTFPAFLEKQKQGDLQVAYGGWAMDYPDAENVFQLLYGPNKAPGPNETNFDHAEMNQLYQQTAVMESGPKRAALIQRMEEITQEEAPWAYLYYRVDYALSQPWLLNYRFNEIIQNKYKYYRISKEVKERYKTQK